MPGYNSYFSQIDPKYLPFKFTRIYDDPGLFTAVNDELEIEALGDKNQCGMFFPGTSLEGIESTASELFADEHARLENVIEGVYGLSFLRRSLVAQPATGAMHLDASAGTGLGEMRPDVEVWRVVLNLGSTARTLAFSLQSPEGLELTTSRGFTTCRKEDLHPALIQYAHLPSRNGGLVTGVRFCASKILHRAEDSDEGNFVAVYGMEKTA